MRDRLKQKLIAAARLNEPSDRVPYAFERRILEAIRRGAVVDPWLAWSRVLSRAAVLCVAITMISGLWVYFRSGSTLDTPDLEHTVFAALDHPGDTW